MDMPKPGPEHKALQIFAGTWTFLASDARGHTRGTWEFTAPGAYRHKMEVSPDGKTWSIFMDGAYRKI